MTWGLGPGHCLALTTVMKMTIPTLPIMPCTWHIRAPTWRESAHPSPWKGKACQRALAGQLRPTVALKLSKIVFVRVYSKWIWDDPEMWLSPFHNLREELNILITVCSLDCGQPLSYSDGMVAFGIHWRQNDPVENITVVPHFETKGALFGGSTIRQ